MKTLFATLFVLVLSLNSALSSTNPVLGGDEKKVKLNVQFSANYGDVVSVALDEKDNALSFSTVNEMSFVQVLDEQGKLEFQLPVFSNDVIIDLDDFEVGKFQINLLMSDDQMISSTFVK